MSKIKDLKDLKPEHIEALKNLHQEHLPPGKERLSSAHQPYSVRKAIENIMPELRDARLGEAGAARATASTSRRGIVEEKEQVTTQVEQQNKKPLNISDPVKVVRKSSVQVKEIETVLKDAQNDLRTAEKAAEKARNAHMAYEDKLRKDYPAESEILNKRDFEKARIAEITKNLEGDSAQTRRKLQSEYNQAIASGDAETASTLKARLKNADEKILEQKKEVATRQSKLDTYDKMIAQVVDQATIDKFNAAESLKANRLAAEEQKTKLGLEVNTIRGALQEAKNPTNTASSLRTTSAPQTAVIEENKQSETPKPATTISETKKPVGTDNQQEASTSPTPVRGNDRTGIPLPKQLDEEKKLTRLKPEQPAPVKGTEERSPQSPGKLERPITIYPDLTGPEVYSKSFVPGGLRGPSDKEQEKALEKLRTQEQSRIAAEGLPGKPKPAPTVAPTVGEKLDSTEQKQPAMQSEGQPTLIKILPTNKPSSNVAISQDPEAPKPTVGGASGPEKRASAQIETTSPPPPPRETAKVPSTSSEAPKPELLPGALAQQIQAGTNLKKLDPVAVELEKKAAQKKDDTPLNLVAEVVNERRAAIAPSKADKAKAKAEEEAFWATPAAQ